MSAGMVDTVNTQGPMRAPWLVLPLLVVLLLPLCRIGAQVDEGRLQSLYQDLRSTDARTRLKAFEAIRSNDAYLTHSETPERLLALLVSERQESRRRQAAGLEADSDLDDNLLGVAWDLWKDRLTSTAFRVFAESSFNSGSPFSRELGARAGRFVAVLLPLAGDPNEYIRANATALIGYALAEDRAQTVGLAIDERAALRRALAAASADRNYYVRAETVDALKMERDAWAIPVLEQMYEREPSLGPSSRDRQLEESFRGKMKSAIQTIRSRAAMPSRDYDALQSLYRDLHSSSLDAKAGALSALVKREDFLGFVDTPDRLLRLLNSETRAIRGRSELEKRPAAHNDTFYEALLAATWQVWKDNLTALTFRLISEGVYDSSSAFVRELASKSSPYMPVLPVLASEPNLPQVRENAVAIMAYVLTDDEAGAVHLTADYRGMATRSLARAAADGDPGVRSSVVGALRQAQGSWAVPILEQMYEREAAFDPSGKNRQSTEAFRANVKAAIQSIQSRTGK
jgi:hypothetical protein